MKTLFFNILPDWSHDLGNEDLYYEDYVQELISYARSDVPTCHITADLSTGRYVCDKNVYLVDTSLPLIHITVTGDDIDGVVNRIKKVNDDNPLINWSMMCEYNLQPQFLESLTYLGRETEYYTDIEVAYGSKGKKLTVSGSRRIVPPCC